MRKFLISVLVSVAMSGCAQTDTMRLSKNEIEVNVSAAPICGGAGAAKTAQRVAAIETLKNGYDSYVIVGADRSNDVHVVQMPGSYTTTGDATSLGGTTSFSATTYYRPGPSMVMGSHDQSLDIRMFHDGEPGAASGISAKETLGPKWADAVKHGTYSCLS